MERIFVRFQSPEQKIDVLQKVASLDETTGGTPKFLFAQPDVFHIPATDELRAELESAGAEIFEDVQFEVCSDEDDDDLRPVQWSSACPQVAGAAALMLSANPSLGPVQVGDIIRRTCSWLAEGKTCVGHGLLDCAEAVERAAEFIPTS